jgi:dipeptidyl aminopeptidase/acylaminoacyl peptidase
MDSIEVYHMTYFSDGLKVNGYIDIPKKAGKYPCIIYNHGGGFEWGDLSFWEYLFAMGNMCKNGYLVIASEFRGIGGSEGAEEFGGNDVHDVLNLVPLLTQLPEADTSRIGMYGVSRGGMMTYLALTKTKAIKAAVVLSGAEVSDIANRPDMDSIFTARLSEYRADKVAFCKKRSAIEHAIEICKTTPLFIIQGTADWRVPTPAILKLITKLYEVKQPFRFSLFEGGTHGVTEFDDEVTRQTKLFFDTYLRDRTKIPSVELHGE